MSLLHRRYRLQVAIVVPLLFAAGCGGGDAKTATTAAAPAPAAATAEASSSAEQSKPSESPAGDKPGGGSAPTQYPCDKVTADEIGKLLGGTYTFKLGAQDACLFDADDPRAFPNAYIAIDQFKTDFPTLKGANPGAKDVATAKGGFVADAPTSKNIKNGYAKLTDDGVTLLVSLIGGEQADRDGKIEDLLKLAVSKL